MNSHRILIVEDERIIANHLQLMIENLGFEVTGAVHNGEDAIEMALKHNPDLILMDIKLNSDIDGIEAASEIHKTIEIPVIFVTSYSDRTTLNRIKEIKNSEYLLKPISLHILRNYIYKAFKTGQYTEVPKDEPTNFTLNK